MLDPAELKYFEDLIRERMQKILSQLKDTEQNLRDATPKESAGDLSAYSVHMPDQGSDSIERELGFYLAEREEKYLAHLNEALNRIREGTFGICRTCNKAISKKRLEAVPNATECIECKSARDSKK